MKRIMLVLSAILCLGLTGCELLEMFDGKSPEENTDETGTGNNNGNGGGVESTTPPPVVEDGRAYVFDMDAVPEIHVKIPLEEWNKLLGYYDENKDTDKYIHCDARFVKNGEEHSIEDAGLRLRGNTSRRRPEGDDEADRGRMHVAGETDWNHVHFMLNLRKFVKDDAHTIGGVRKIHLKWFKDDPNYARELFCYDLFRRFGIPTAIKTSYCRLWLHVEGDAAETYYGVYAMLEAIDEEYLKARRELFGDDSQNLWKCGWGADLNSDDTARFISDDDAGTDNYAYVLKTNTENYAAAEVQIIDFIRKLRGKGDASFAEWIPTVTDVELLLRTYAVNVAVGMWDDYWNNQNNYYIYFNTSDQYNYKFFFIPYDYDNTLGTSNSIDPARQNPLSWGSSDRPLIKRLLDIPEYRKIYLDALHEICSDDNLMSAQGSIARIRAWQARIADHVANDTGEDMVIEDRPASWSNYQHYRLLEAGANNYFSVKASGIPAN